jgi:2-haloalkanoic acid dehalogenase type II
MFDLTPEPKVITFDCYGTLVQWREVLLRELADIAKAEGRDPKEAIAILDTFSKVSHVLTNDKPHRLYKEILRVGFRNALKVHGFPASDERVEMIAQSVPTMGPHPEVPEVLRKLRTRYKLAIFTNSDDDLIAHNVEKIGVPIDYVITAEQAQAYKPSRAIFEHAHRVMGVKKEETVHVAMSMVLDMQACHELGIRGIWINRRGEKGNPDWLPYVELPNLAGVPDLLLPDAGVR